MLISTLFEKQKENFKFFFPNIAINESDIKRRFLKRYSRFPGVNKTNIYVLPEILDTDARWLKLCEMIRTFITRKVDIVGSIYLDVPLREKDANRLLCVPSAAMIPTIGNPEYLLDVKYTDEYHELFLECLNMIKEEVKVPDINTVVRKKKNSSSGSFISSMDTKFFSSLFANFEKELFLLGHDGIREKFDQMDFVYTIPITRRMIKAPKVIEDYSINGKKVKITRELDKDTKEEIQASVKFTGVKISLEELVGPKHRAANNVSEIERMTHFYYQTVVDSERALFPLSMKYDESYIHELVKRVNAYNQQYLKNNNLHPANKVEFLEYDGIYNFFDSDGTAFDKHIQEQFMVALQNYYSSYFEKVNICYDYVGFLSLFRKKKHIVISKNEHEVTLLEELLKYHRSYSDKYFPIKGLDSGEVAVHADGKKNRLITEVAIVNKTCNGRLAKKEKLEILKGFAKLRGEIFGWHENIYYYVINSSDDNKICTLNFLIKKIRKVVEENNTKMVKDFLPIEEDPEFLSMVMFLDDDFNFHYVPNLSRRVASLLKPEHSVVLDKENGIIKDIKYSFTDKFNTILSFGKVGEEIIEKFMLYFQQLFGCEFWTYIEQALTKYSVNVGDLEIHELADLNEDERLLLYDLDKYFYKVDQSKIRNSIIEKLFWNINPDRLKNIFEKCGYQYVFKTDAEKNSYIEKCRKEALDGLSRSGI